MLQDRGLQRGDLTAGLETEFGPQPLSHAGQLGQGVALTSGSVQPERQLRCGSLPIRVLGNMGAGFADGGVGITHAQQRIDPVLPASGASFVETGDRPDEHDGVFEAGKGTAPPERECLEGVVDCAPRVGPDLPVDLVGQLFELGDVGRPIAEFERVAVCDSDQIGPVWPECGAQA